MLFEVTIRSRIIEVENQALGLQAGGYFEDTFQIDGDQLRHLAAPRDFIVRTISLHLAGCVKYTGFPLGEGLWTVTIPTGLANATGLPKEFRL